VCARALCVDLNDLGVEAGRGIERAVAARVAWLDDGGWAGAGAAVGRVQLGEDEVCERLARAGVRWQQRVKCLDVARVDVLRAC
jgi:hypothetical protein